jgi:hypothetical protein
LLSETGAIEVAERAGRGVGLPLALEAAGIVVSKFTPAPGRNASTSCAMGVPGGRPYDREMRLLRAQGRAPS